MDTEKIAINLIHDRALYVLETRSRTTSSRCCQIAQNLDHLPSSSDWGPLCQLRAVCSIFRLIVTKRVGCLAIWEREQVCVGAEDMASGLCPFIMIVFVSRILRARGNNNSLDHSWSAYGQLYSGIQVFM